MEPEGLVLTGEQPTGATTDKVGKGTVPCSRTTPVPTTDFFSFLSKSQRPYIPTGQRDSILPGCGTKGQGLLETGQCMVTAEGLHQHRHSRVTDGIALEAAGTGQGTVDVTVLGPGGSHTQPGAMPMGSTGGWGPKSYAPHLSFLSHYHFLAPAR